MWIVVDEARRDRGDEITHWGPFATEAEAEAWEDVLLAEYTEDGEDQSDWIDHYPLYRPEA